MRTHDIAAPNFHLPPPPEETQGGKSLAGLAGTEINLRVDAASAENDTGSIISALKDHKNEIRACLDAWAGRQEHFLRHALAEMRGTLSEHLPPKSCTPACDSLMPSPPRTLTIGSTDAIMKSGRLRGEESAIGNTDAKTMLDMHSYLDAIARNANMKPVMELSIDRLAQAVSAEHAQEAQKVLKTSLTGSSELSRCDLGSAEQEENLESPSTARDLEDMLAGLGKINRRSKKLFGRYALTDTEAIEDGMEGAICRNDSEAQQIVNAKVKTQEKIVADKRSERKGTYDINTISSLRSSLIRCRRKLKPLLENGWFEGIVFILIVSNAVTVGLDANAKVQSGGQDQRIYTFIELLHTVAFTVELFLRFFVEGFSFLSRRNLSWNMFDCFVVCTSIVDSAMDTLQFNASHFRMIRIFRIVRMLRLVRFIPAFRTLAHTLLVTVKSMVWPLILLSMLLYGFSVTFTNAVADHYAATASGPDDHPLYDEFFGTLPKAMRSLFWSITGGVDWCELLPPLQQLGPFWVAMFIFFVTFTVFAVCNAITGVFCQNAIESAQMDKDLVTTNMLANRSAYTKALNEMFREIDARDKSGDVTLKEFEDYLGDHEHSRAYLDSLDISTRDVWSLFRILDADGQGTLDAKEFVNGCLNFRGPARAMHIAKVERDVKSLRSLLELHIAELKSVDRIASPSARLPPYGPPEKTGCGSPSHHLWIN